MRKKNIKGTGQKLYKKAKNLIPGGTMLLSKRPEMFLPDLWPSYYSKAKKQYVWDLDNNKYLDMSIMAIGTNILGYANKHVDNAVIKNIRKSNMSTFNCPEEVKLAEKLLELDNWAQMVRFAKTGGEANAIAIRIARASSGKSKVAICGYHGWHDWYLSLNHTKDNELENHLLPNLSISGVPSELKNTNYSFLYNDFNSFKKLIDKHDIGTVKMEVERSNPPKDNFLERIRETCTKKGIVLIFDECTSGFRQTSSGLYKKYNVIPDMVIYGKALGNGYPITAILGKKEDESAQKTFISSTFWTERSGVTAALETLKIMKSEKSWEIITEIGKKFQKGLKDCAKNNKISLSINGIPALTSFNINSKSKQLYKTLITKKLLDKNILASNLFYPCIYHKNSDLKRFFDCLDDVFSKIYFFENGRDNIENYLNSPIAHDSFKRLN